ncbi:hypothetical protein ACHAXA_004739 [Cyclostephanos tholiformis]|uniref:SAP domain-containing protein n=1 Tax=Cyclostephanos tholiformis TaxID=382380 RepID=A0ABD3SRN6_9STRA
MRSPPSSALALLIVVISSHRPAVGLRTTNIGRTLSWPSFARPPGGCSIIARIETRRFGTFRPRVPPPSSRTTRARSRPMTIDRRHRPSDDVSRSAMTVHASTAYGDENDDDVPSTITNASDDGRDDENGEANRYDDGGYEINGGGGSVVGGGIDGPLLDGETYLRAEYNLLRPDGTLHLDEYDGWGGRYHSSAESAAAYYPPPTRIKNRAYIAAAQGLFSPAPSYYYLDTPNDHDDDDDDDRDLDLSTESRRQLSDEELLYLAVVDIESMKNNTVGAKGGGSASVVDSETLHRRVFDEERAYLEQSEKFRKSLSSSMTTSNGDEDESLIAMSRREEIEKYDEGVLSDLIREIDAMEEMAISREEAMRLLVNDDRSDDESADDNTNDGRGKRGGGGVGRRDDFVRCSKCGLRVTPDMIQRAEAIENISNGYGRGEGGTLARRKYCNDVVVPSIDKLCCSACYGMRFRATNEATVRTAIWSGGGSPSSFVGGGFSPSSSYSSSSSRRFDGKWNNDEGRRSRSNGRYDVGKENWNKSRSTNTVQGISTSSLFDMPERGRYNAEMRGSSSQLPKMLIDAAALKTPRNTNDVLPRRDKSTFDNSRRRSSPPRRTSSIVWGGEELARRMQRDTESRDDDNLVERRTKNGRTYESRTVVKRDDPTSNIGEEDDGVSLGSVDGGLIISNDSNDDDVDKKTTSKINVEQSWVTIEDPVSKRILHWNTDTGEMIDNISKEEEDASGRAMREAVRKYEEEMKAGQSEKKIARTSWDNEMMIDSPPQQSPSKGDAINEVEFIDMIDDSAPESVDADYSKMTVSQLKDLLRSKGLKVSGKKEELIERLERS